MCHPEVAHGLMAVRKAGASLLEKGMIRQWEEHRELNPADRLVEAHLSPWRLPRMAILPMNFTPLESIN